MGRVRGLFVRYLMWIGSATILPLLLAIGVLASVALWEAEQGLIRLHEARAQGIAVRVENFVSTMADDLSAALRLASKDGDRQVIVRYDEEILRLLRRHPAITDLALVNTAGRERLSRSRFEDDRVHGGRDWSSHPAFVGVNPASAFVEAAYFYRDSEPRTRIAVRGEGPNAFVLIAEISLRMLWDLAAEKRFSDQGIAYVITETGALIAHPDRNLVLRHQNLAQLFEDGLFVGTKIEPASLVPLRRVNGESIVHTRLPLPAIHALLVLEEVREDAYRPVFDLIKPSVLILGFTLLIALLASALLARVIVRPLRLLQESAARLGGGDLEHRIHLPLGDEIGELADGFNRMADHVRDERRLLETRVLERTADLARQKDEISLLANALHRKKEEAESANAAKTRFLAAASHDLRQPMHAIGLLVGVLRRRLGEHDAPAILESLESSVGAMERLFSALLDISQLDAGTVEPHLIDFPLSALFLAIEEDLGVLARDKDVELRIARTSTWVHSDPELLERIVRNLVSNAVRYTPSGGVLLGCRLNAGGEGVMLQVVDTGIGIEQADISRIFMEFVQIGNRERNRAKGLGLGLSIVKRTAELLGHHLAVRSNPGKGSCFSIQLPRVTKKVFSGVAAGGQIPSLAGRFVVFIDDDPEIRRAMEVLLELWQCHAIVAATTAEAMSALTEHIRVPDIIVCDYRLPNEDGIAAITCLRQALGMEIPALAITGDIASADLARIEAAGLRLLHKPLSPDRLEAAVAAALEAQAEAVP